MVSWKIHTEGVCGLLTMWDRVLPWCLLANSFSESLPPPLGFSDEALRWEGIALLIAEAIVSSEWELLMFARQERAEGEKQRLFVNGLYI